MPHEFFDDEERNVYQADYMKCVEDLAKDYAQEDANQIFDIMVQENNVIHSESGTTDGALNWLKSEKAFKKRQHKFGKAEESYMNFIAHEDGKNINDVRRDVAKMLKKGGNR